MKLRKFFITLFIFMSAFLCIALNVNSSAVSAKPSPTVSFQDASKDSTGGGNPNNDATTKKDCWVETGFNAFVCFPDYYAFDGQSYSYEVLVNLQKKSISVSEDITLFALRDPETKACYQLKENDSVQEVGTAGIDYRYNIANKDLFIQEIGCAHLYTISDTTLYDIRNSELTKFYYGKKLSNDEISAINKLTSKKWLERWNANIKVNKIKRNSKSTNNVQMYSALNNDSYLFTYYTNDYIYYDVATYVNSKCDNNKIHYISSQNVDGVVSYEIMSSYISLTDFRYKMSWNSSEFKDAYILTR